MTQGRHVAVVAPHATRSGSTRVLLELVGRAVRDHGWSVEVELLTGGGLAEPLLALGATAAAVPSPQCDLVLVNGALGAGTPFVAAARAVGLPIVVYLHESLAVLVTLDERARGAILGADVVICVSEAMRDDAISFGVAAGRVAVVPPIIVDAEPPTDRSIARARAQMAAAPGDQLVVGCGEARWGKGPDLFVEVVGAIDRADLRFAWIGRRSRALARQVDHDAAAIGATSSIAWLGEVADVRAHLAAADALLVTSRDDPQPLVPLEAAQLGVPTVAFAVGGLRDLAAAGAALVVDYPDVTGLAGALQRCLRDPMVGAELVAGARRRIVARQAPEVVVPAFLAAMEAAADGGQLEASW